MKKHLVIRIALVLLCFNFGCSLGGPLRVDPKAHAYDLPALPETKWTKPPINNDLNTFSADAIYRNKKSGSYLAINSLCDRYPDASLDNLANQLVTPFESPETLRSEKRTVDGRDALFSLVRGKVDGVYAEEAFLVVRKDDCIFDFTLDSKNKIPEDDLKDFENLIRGFRYHDSDGKSGDK